MKPLNRSTVTTRPRPISVVQFGSGNFLRAFVDWMIQRANAAGIADIGVAMLYATHREDRHDPLVEQDGLYQVLLEGIRDGELRRDVELVDVIQEIIDPWQDPARVSALAASPQVHVVVSNTTEAGITYQEDEDLTVRPAASFPGRMAQFLHDRFRALGGADAPGVHIVCCELIEDNASTLRRMVLRHAERAGWGREFAAWVRDRNHFHNTLVDRIVSGYPADDVAWVQERTGLVDGALVKGEQFSLWAIDGDPSLAQVLPVDRIGVGAQLVTPAHLRRFREKKVRILNGAHTALAQFGRILGHETVDQAFGDPELRGCIRAMVEEEVLPTIDEPREQSRAFAASVLERFDIPSLHHRLQDIALNSVSKWATRNRPVVADRWAAGRPAAREVLALACLLRIYAGSLPGTPAAPRDDKRVLHALGGLDVADAHALEPVLAGLGLADGVDAGRLAEETAHWARVLVDRDLRQVLRELGPTEQLGTTTDAPGGDDLHSTR